jgi:glucan phosphorylase
MVMSQIAEARVAYFSMEVAIASYIPTYSGGLGVLAGDMLRAAADLRVPMIGVTLVHRLGYLEQELDEAGSQKEAFSSRAARSKSAPTPMSSRAPTRAACGSCSWTRTCRKTAKKTAP